MDRRPCPRALPQPRRGTVRALRARGLLAGLAVGLAGCGPPAVETGRPLSDAGPAPVILPLDEVLAQTDLPGLEPSDTAALQARAADLTARAGALAETEADPETRARLDAALAAKAE